MVDRDEMLNIVVSIIVLGFIFTFRGFDNLAYLKQNLVPNTILVSIAFLAHELAHRETARRLGFFARYELWGIGVFISLFLSLATNGEIGFASLGAVVIYPISDLWGVSRPLTRRDNMLISIAGPLTNIILGIAGILLYYIYPSPYIGRFSFLNLWLAFFNLLPIPPLDGFKVFKYDWRIYTIITLPLFVSLLFL